MQKITPCLWFNGDAEDAASFYVTLLPNSRINRVFHSPADTPRAPRKYVRCAGRISRFSHARGCRTWLIASYCYLRTTGKNIRNGGIVVGGHIDPQRTSLGNNVDRLP